MALFGKSEDLSKLPPAMADLGASQARKTLGLTAPKAKARKESDYTTSGAYVNPKVALALIEAPDYRESTLKKESCSTCKQYRQQNGMLGVCTKFDFMPRRDFVCSKWISSTHP